MNTLKILQDLGLSKKQAKIYLVGLELGPATAHQIALKASMPRSTVYEVLEDLQSKNLVSIYLKKKIKHFSMQEPEQLLDVAEDSIKNFKNVLPELNAICGSAKNRPKVRFYQGKDGMRTILKEILKEADTLLSFASADDLFAILDKHFEKFVEERIKRKIPVKVLFCKNTKKAQERKRLGPRYLREARILNGEFLHSGLIFIWKDKIAMFSFTGDHVAVVTESKELAQVQRAMFMYLWQVAK